jgi:putative phage-type endonuclease
MKTLDILQGTEEWKAARAGHVTASRICDVMATIKSGKGESASRRNYKAEIVVEQLTGTPTPDGYTNAAMQWGNDQEPFARAAYELKNDVMVDQIGFVYHPTILCAGASPDGLVGDDGLVEIKCPNTATHLAYLLANEPPADYFSQMQWQMACTGRLWCDFVSYDPRVPANLQLFVKRLYRDQEFIDRAEKEVVAFLDEVSEMLDRLSHL